MKTYCLTNPLRVSPDIVPLQTALRKDGFYHGAIDGIFGPATGDACYTAKFHLGYPNRGLNHCGGQTLLDYLRGSTELPLTYRATRRLRGFGINRDEKIRNKLVEYALWGIANSAQIHYAQVRPMDHLKKIKALPWWADCSEDVTTYYCWADGPDPNGLKFSGEGYTGSMLDNGKTIALSQAKPGDLVIFGPHPGHHVVMLLQSGTANDGDPDISSHGQESGPKRTSLSVELAYQPKPMTVKRYIGV